MKKKRLLQTHIQKEKTPREVNNRKTKRQTDWESIKQGKGVSFFKQSIERWEEKGDHEIPKFV